MPKSIPLEERFWPKVSGPIWPTGCWEWMAGCSNDGYGGIRNENGRSSRAHRIAWRLTQGEIPEGMIVCHKCDNPKCCNPDHLFLGTTLDNVRDKWRKGRGPSGDRHGFRKHPESAPRGERHGSRTHPERVPRGEHNGNSRLTLEQVREIRRLYIRYEVTLQSLADRFGVGLSTVSKIVYRVTWKEEK